VIKEVSLFGINGCEVKKLDCTSCQITAQATASASRLKKQKMTLPPHEEHHLGVVSLP